MKTINDIINEASQKDFKIKGINVDELINKLKDAFCEEMNAWYQYYIIIPFLVGSDRKNVEADYKENGDEELKHANKLLNRINELGGDLNSIMSPDLWNKTATHKFIMPGTGDVLESVNQMIEAEKGAIETYTTLEVFTRDKDVVTNQIVKEILADEQTHLQEMIEFSEDIK